MNIFDIKQSNRNRIYFYIREKGLATTKDIAYDLKLSLPTVTQNLDYLAKQGLISSEDKVVNKSGGRNPIAHSYVADVKVAIGLDIAKNHIISTIVDLNGDDIKHIYQKIEYKRNDGYLKLLGEAVERIIESAQLDRGKILGVGIAVPGIVNHEEDYVVDGRVIDNTGMTCEEFSKYIPYSTKLIHDSYASVFSESWMSSELHNAFYFRLCHSVGGSVLLNDNIYLGDGLYSGEVGHLNIIPNGKQCYCGQKGCLDAYCSAEVLENYADGDLDLFFERLEQGEERLIKVWDDYLNHLAIAVSDIRMLFGCKIILGGDVGVFMQDYMDVLYEKVSRRSPFGEDSRTFLTPFKKKKYSVATGAGLYFVDKFFNNM
ncbi:ROK family transcriptional regulator [Cellulosilyticum sp. I15G10I2]|uniref:ROK family transcriptional regulator n=1 Tax=Cellulosilyticum sp. I15G10I2 TaxID=1892843 RepID=UPI00085CBD7A|nr:ROK family transcriptional regulator [Cellulosilyticum sp. I15G10I2]